MANPDSQLSRLLLLLLPLVAVLLVFPAHVLDRLGKPSAGEMTTATLNASGSLPRPAQYELGLGYVLANRSMGTEKGWAKVSEAAHIAYIQRKWPEWNSKQLAEDIRMARRKRLRIYLAFEALANDRKKLKIPDGLQGDFSSPEIREAYLKTVVDTAREVKPDYFVANVEMNLYKRNNPKDYEAFRLFYPQVYREIKKASPQTKVAVSVTYSDYNGKDGIDAEDKAAFRRFVDDFDKGSDIFAVSTYPFSFKSPSAIPEGFLKEIASYSVHPLFIAETGWVSHNFTIKFPGLNYRFKSSPQEQAEFIDRLRLCADYAERHGACVSAINYVSLIDIGWVGRKVVQMAMPQIEWFCYLGLVESSGKEKPAFAGMAQWKRDIDASAKMPK